MPLPRSFANAVQQHAHYNLQRMEAAIAGGPVRKSLSCTNQAHAFAAFPQLDKNILVKMRQVDFPWLAGVFSPSEAMQAHELGFSALKLFPAQQAGGIGMLKAMNGPLPEIHFCPTGGIDAQNFIDFLSLPNVICAGGSWVCPASAIRNHDWERIRQLAEDVHHAIKLASECHGRKERNRDNDD